MFKYPIDVEDIPQEELRELFLHWQKIKGDRIMPRRADFRPSDVPKLLPYILLADVENDPRRYRFRLIGTATTRAMSRDVTGQYLETVPGTADMKERWDWIVENKIPYLYQGKLVWSEKSFLEYFALGLPFSEDGQNVNQIMYGLYYMLPKDRRTIPPQ
ncbi:PAS domain-containing protein [Emcibacter sp.]|uniref:PAS domain-containing protein n=1 Tax=Emcibacter sp. TaxID=1979954 RepID=UPI002AA92B4B|nr:PAS domain-containing protein [Emcibacter sp.]